MMFGNKIKLHQSHAGTGLIFGAGLGMIFGQLIFGEAGMGMVFGTGIGLVFGSGFSAVPNCKKNDDFNSIE